MSTRINKPLCINMGVFLFSKSDESPLNRGHPHINKQGLIHLGSTLVGRPQAASGGIGQVYPATCNPAAHIGGLLLGPSSSQI